MSACCVTEFETIFHGCVTEFQTLSSGLIFWRFLILAPNSRGARDSKIGKKWPESSRILDYIIS